MKIKQTIIALVMSIGISVALSTLPVYAADTCGPDKVVLQPGQSCCGGVVTSIISCDQSGSGGTIEDTGVWGLLLLVINIMTAGVGVLAVGGIVYGSILYATATDSLDKRKKAKDTIFNVVVGIVAYALMYSFLNYIVPGGIFN